MIREELLALADELEEFEDGDCEECIAYGQPECKGHLSCAEIIARYSARKVREAVERDGEGATTVSAHDLLSEDEREAIAWVREHGGLGAVEKRLMPEGMEWLLDVWPKWSNGEYCKFGDWWKAEKYSEREPRQLSRLAFFTPEQLREWGQDEGENFGYEWDFMRPSDTTYRPDKAEPPAPKVLDADGVEIRVGDTVYGTVDMEYRITSLSKYEPSVVNAKAIEGGNECGDELIAGSQKFNSFQLRASKLTHQRPVLDADGNRIEPAMDVWWVCESDERGIHAGKLHVESIGEDGFVTCSPFNGGTWVELDSTELYVHEPVLDADGVLCREGDEVWEVRSHRRREIVGTNYCDHRTGEPLILCDSDDEIPIPATFVTHAKPESPDTYAKLYEDVHDERCGSEEFVRRCRALVEKENKNE